MNEHECKSWDCSRAIPFLGIFVSNFQHCIFNSPFFFRLPVTFCGIESSGGYGSGGGGGGGGTHGVQDWGRQLQDGI